MCIWPLIKTNFYLHVQVVTKNSIPFLLCFIMSVSDDASQKKIKTMVKEKVFNNYGFEIDEFYIFDHGVSFGKGWRLLKETDILTSDTSLRVVCKKSQGGSWNSKTNPT